LLVVPPQLRIRPLRQRQEVARVGAAGGIQLARCIQPLPGVRAHRFQHAEGGLRALALLICAGFHFVGARGQEQAFLGERHQPLQGIAVVARNRRLLG